MELHGIHHVTAITARAKENHAFYTGALGMRLVKKTVNQDDVSAYHLFYADGAGTPGTDLTFFDWPAPPERRGTRSVIRTGLRVPAKSLAWWAARFEGLAIPHGTIAERGGRATLDFEDHEGQRLSLVADEASAEWQPWAKSPVPAEHQIRGLGPLALSTPKPDSTARVFRELLGLELDRTYVDAGRDVSVYRAALVGPAAELHLVAEPGAPSASQGAGAVHHLALRTTLADYPAWAERLASFGVPNSGPVDRFWFRSLYFREPGGILIEIATDEPGFTADESLATLGETLSLPPFLEPRRQEIEAGLVPL